VKVLFYDSIQLSNAPKELRSPALAEKWEGTDVVIILDQPREITGIGITYTNARQIDLSFNLAELIIIEGNTDAPQKIYDDGADLVQYDLEIDSNVHATAGATFQTIMFNGNGLYRIKPIVTDRITLIHDGSYIGRFGAGVAVDLRTAIAKEPGWASTAESRKTLSGQIIPGVGGYTYRTVSLDVRYKISAKALNEIEAAYKDQIGRGYPYFLMFDREAARLPFLRLYARDTKTTEYVFQGGINRYLFSRKFDFEECF
jgi:hypothetical protein